MRGTTTPGAASRGVVSGRLISLFAAAAAVIVLPSCGAIVESAVENVAEEAVGVEVEEGEDGSFSIEGEDISIQLETDEEGGSLSIEGSDGNVQVETDEDGTVTVESEGFEGEEDQELTITSDAEVPDDFPLPYLDGGVVESGTTWDNGESVQMVVTLRYDSSRIDELVALYDDYFEGKETLTTWDSESNGQRIVGYTTNPDGRPTGVSIATDDAGITVFLETTVLSS